MYMPIALVSIMSISIILISVSIIISVQKKNNAFGHARSADAVTGFC